MPKEKEPLYAPGDIIGEGAEIPIGEIELPNEQTEPKHQRVIEKLERDISFGRKAARIIKSPTARKYIIGAGIVGGAIVAGYKLGEYLRKSDIVPKRIFKEDEVEEEMHLDIDIEKDEYDSETRKIIKPSAVSKYVDFFRRKPEVVEELEKKYEEAEKKKKHMRFVGALGTVGIIVGGVEVLRHGDDAKKLIEFGKRALEKAKDKKPGETEKPKRFRLFARRKS